MGKGLEKFNVKECLIINFKNTIFFSIALMIPIVIDYIIFKVTFNNMKELDNGLAYLILMVMFLIFILIVLLIYSIIVIIKMKIYENFIDNMKALSSLAICNIIVTIFLSKLTTVSLAFIYIGTIFSASAITFISRYYHVKFKK